MRRSTALRPVPHASHAPCARSDLSNEDHGGIVARDADGRLYVDVVLHNRRDATDNPIDDPWEVLEPSATYTLCLRKNPANLVRQRALFSVSWWEDDDDDSAWIFIPTDIIHEKLANRTMPAYTHTAHTQFVPLAGAGP